MSALRYKVVEVGNVTDLDLEKALNEWTGAGWDLERIDYVQEPGVRRPQMAFLYFTRREDPQDQQG